MSHLSQKDKEGFKRDSIFSLSICQALFIIRFWFSHKTFLEVVQVSERARKWIEVTQILSPCAWIKLCFFVVAVAV